MLLLLPSPEVLLLLLPSPEVLLLLPSHRAAAPEPPGWPRVYPHGESPHGESPRRAFPH